MIDETVTYIKMCLKAEELQAHKGHDQIAVGSYVYYGLGNEHFIGLTIGIAEFLPLKEVYYYVEDIIWLPTQEDLQGMVGNSSLVRPWVDLCYCFYKWAHLNWNYFSSMGQLWLAFVQYEKYGKVWVNDNWETIALP